MKAVIFDMDGLMIDSESLHLKAWNVLLKKYRVQITEEDWSKHVGSTAEESAHKFKKEFGLSESEKKLLEIKTEHFKHLLKTIQPNKGLIELLDRLVSDKIPIAIASQSGRELVKYVLKCLNLTVFQYISDRGQHIRAKPAPDLYLDTAKHLGVEPQDCLVLEDSGIGVHAAKAANMTCYAIPSPEAKNDDFSMADRVLVSLEEVYEHFLVDMNI